MWCSYCGSSKHDINYCPETWEGQANRNKLKCTYCGSSNHNRDACPHAYPGPNPVRLSKDVTPS